jgi:RNA polymerase sigma-70 factor (ECF subfamily)
VSGGPGGPVKDSRAYLFRIATNLWIDQVRRNQIPLTADAAESSSKPEQRVSAREAVSVLLVRVGPQERAAVMLKDVFDFTLEEIAEMLSSTVDAIKSALHRGRASLEETRDTRRASFRAPSKQLIDRLVAAFNARDVNLVTLLLADNVTLEVPGVGGERGKNMIWLRTSSEESRAESVMFNREWIVVQWGGPRSAPILVTAERFEEEDGYVTRIREYFYCPETLAEIAAELGSHARPHGYHQAPDVLSRMFGDAVLPWTSTPALPR